jgi:hypothetical protein
MIEPKEQARALFGSRADISVGLTGSGGYIALSWSNGGAVGRWDFVALYDKPPTDPHGYLTNQWTYTSNQSSPYTTGTKTSEDCEKPSYWAAYVGYDYKSGDYEILATAGPVQL